MNNCMRLDKYLAESASLTRSEAKKLLRQGAVTVNGSAANRPEQKIDPGTDQVSLAGKELVWKPFEYLMLNKPAGVITATRDPRQKTVLDLIGEGHKNDLFPVGRLDVDTEGLLLLCNDGPLAHRLLSPGKHVEKGYEALVAGTVDETDIRAFRNGVEIGEDRPTLPSRLQILSAGHSVSDSFSVLSAAEEEALRREGVCETPDSPISRVRLWICEGKFHQVKRMFLARGKKVLYLKRFSMGPLILDESLCAGQWRHLTSEEIYALENAGNQALSEDIHVLKNTGNDPGSAAEE